MKATKRVVIVLALLCAIPSIHDRCLPPIPVTILLIALIAMSAMAELITNRKTQGVMFGLIGFVTMWNYNPGLIDKLQENYYKTHDLVILSNVIDCKFSAGSCLKYFSIDR